jgi:uncharacterized repeat protein (TIGR03803 family)
MFRLVVLLSTCAVLSTVSTAQAFKTFVNFDGTHGGVPYGTLVQDADGNFYGTTSAGGSYNRGTVFKATPQGALTALHSFKGQPSDGSYPYGGLLLATDGNFYGTASNGGTSNQGVVFKTTPAGAFSIIHNFCPQSGCADGAYPASSLVQGNDGYLYGTTVYGGSSFCGHGCGTIFKINFQGTLTTLYRFCNSQACTDGVFPYAGLALASDGNFYGTTYAGGAYDLGIAFKITPGGALTILHNFRGKPTDGASPYGALLPGDDGNYYGTTSAGGLKDSGTVFRMTPKGSTTLLHSFCSQDACADGTTPEGALFHASDGNFYGTTLGSVSNCCGTAFAITPEGSLTTLHVFHGYPVDGSSPVSRLMQAIDRRLYGTTQGGASYNNGCGCGTVFSLPPPIVPLSVTKEGSGTVISGDGNIYCGNTCSHSYADGTQMGLTAIPSPGYTFSTWSGCTKVEGSFCTVAMVGATNVTASFAAANVTLSSIVLNPSSLRGGNITVATVTLEAPAPPGGVGVNVTTNQPLVVHPPSRVVVPGGYSSFSFAVRTTPVRTTTVATVKAVAGASQVNATLTVTTAYGPPLQSAR